MAATELTWLEDFPSVSAKSEPSGWVAQINRVLAVGDSTVWSEETTIGVKALQKRAGLRADGVVHGKTWALFLSPIELGRPGGDVSALRAVHGLEPGHWFKKDLADVLGVESLDQAGWAGLAGLTLEPIPEPVVVEEAVVEPAKADAEEVEVADDEAAPKRKRAAGAP